MRLFLSSLFALLALTALTASEAHAAEPASNQLAPAQPAPEQPTEVHWYGWQTLTVDAAAVGTMYIAGHWRSPTLAWTGVGTYALGPAIVHICHDRPEIALLDVLMRVGTPLLFGYVASHMGSNSSDRDMEGAVNAVAGGVLGSIAASVVDSTVLARETVPVEPPKGIAWSPTVSVTPQGASAGVAGTF